MLILVCSLGPSMFLGGANAIDTGDGGSSDVLSTPMATTIEQNKDQHYLCATPLQYVSEKQIILRRNEITS